MKNTLLNTLNKAPLAAMLLALLAVTAAREIALFTSFAASDRDQLLAGLFALALVLAKPMMAAAAGQQWAADNKPLAVVCWLLVVPLLALSIASTVLYFESAYQVQAVAEQQSSSEYQNTAATISAKQTTAELMKQTAADLKDDGNTLNARRLLEKAALIDDELADLREQQNSLPAAATTAASISGNHLGGWRWGAWITVSVMGDLLQIVAVLLLTANNAPAKTDEVVQNGRQNSEQKTEQKEQNKTAENKQTEQNKKQNGEQKQTEKTAPPKQPGKWLADQISTTGQLPTVREAKAAGVNYGSYTDQIQQLLAAGVIQQKASGKGWQVAAE
ncbi:hypothetical protein [Thalassolituus sp. UBA2009]|uniref:hypothetical protein n=1 Tax=Thalassolituus sp. UBA2009 TaxID=1947658 RepID=UPI00257DB888|nr:hypothetical protein [Thalassolituus sp. UBA2009]